jgi:hypothetical protein
MTRWVCFGNQLCEGQAQLNVVQIVAAQPSLLLQDEVEMAADETAADRATAWRHGLVSDNNREWARHFEQLLEYKGRHGDPHVGFRDEDEPDLAR